MLHGGNSLEHDLYIEPTIVEGINLDDPLMQEEIFGPILPVVEYTNLAMATAYVKQNPNPLAFYIFTQSDKLAEEVIREVPFGGGCVNNTLFHLANPNLPFGGIGNSGSGLYHGKYSYDCFSHAKAVVKTRGSFDVGPHYMPYGNKKSLMKLLIH